MMLDCVVVKDVPVVGVQMDTVDAVAQPVLPVLGGGGAVVPPVDGGGVGDAGGGVAVVPDPELERVTSSLSVLGFPAPSYAVISIRFDPA